MPRLIDADKVAEAIAWLDEYDFVIWHDVQECIDKVPTVDAVPTDFHDKCMQIEIEKRLGMEEVVRCKDCKYCDRGNCTFWDDGYGAIVSMDDFCSQGERGERREDDVVSGTNGTNL